MNQVLHGIEDFHIAREDTLRNPAFSDASTGGLLTFDCVIANPPFSLKEDWTLSIYRYVLPPIGEDIPPLPEAVDAFKAALAEDRAAEDRLRTVLTKGGWLA